MCVKFHEWKSGENRVQPRHECLTDALGQKKHLPYAPPTPPIAKEQYKHDKSVYKVPYLIFLYSTDIQVLN